MRGGPDLFGATHLFDPAHHEGANGVHIAQIKNGRWKSIPIEE
jgi:hypothetical protein